MQAISSVSLATTCGPPKYHCCRHKLQTDGTFSLTRLLTADRWRQALLTVDARSHQQMAEFETKVCQKINDVVETQLEKIVSAEMKNVVIPR